MERRTGIRLGLDNLVLGTVNASWKRCIEADVLARAIIDNETDEWLCHLATFFGEVRRGLILEFAEVHEIPIERLLACHEIVKAKTGEGMVRE